jgi:hypothetical protein
MDNLYQFRVGDRVRARTSGFVPAGTLGAIRQVLYSAPRFYFVQFDGFDHSRLMHARDLERDMTPVIWSSRHVRVLV